jgi:hypothetical protein
MTNELWNCQFRAKYSSFFWGLVLSSVFCSLFIKQKNFAKKGIAFYGITYFSMYNSKVAFSERIIDIMYPVFKEDVLKYQNEVPDEKINKIATLGKSAPVNKKLMDKEIELMKKKYKSENVK